MHGSKLRCFPVYRMRNYFRWFRDIPVIRLKIVSLGRIVDICVEGLIVVDPCKPRLPVDRDYQCSFAVVFTQFRAGISCRRVDRIERHVLAARGGTQAWIEFDVSAAIPMYKLKRNRPIAGKREENGIERITMEARSISDGRELGRVRRGIRNRFGQQPETALSFDRKFGGE